MREIKFRGWHPQLTRMFSAEEMGQDQLTLLPDGRGFINVSGADIRLSQLVPMIPMQFIGTHDGNGQDIYESDIISFTINFSDERLSSYWSESGFEGEVFFDKFGWAIRNVKFPKMFDQEYVFKMQGRDYDKALLERYCKVRSASFSDISSIMVIRNIYEP